MPLLILKGRFIEGPGPCQAFETTDGTPWWVVGDLSGAKLGEDLFVAGEEAAAGPCGNGRTLLVSWIADTPGTALNPNAKYQRDVEVRATYSTRDDSAMLLLEGSKQRLTYNNAGLWIGKYLGLEITGTLQQAPRTR
jgi:hypothetical protein